MASGPAVPNANELSKAQTKSNIKTAVAQTGLNAINQSGPGGSSTYKQIGTWPDGTPRFEQTTTLSQPLQNVFDTGVQTQQQIGNTARDLAGNLSGTLQPITQPQYQQYGNGPQLNTQGGQMGNLATNVSGGPISNQGGQINPITSQIANAGPVNGNIANAGPVNGSVANAGQIQRSIGPSDYAGQRQSVEDALLGRVNQSYDRDRASIEQQLANQGIQVGSEAYRNKMDDFNRGLAEARTSAVLGAGQEQNRLQQLELNAGNFTNTAQQQQYGQNANNTALGLAAQQQRFGQNAAQTQSQLAAQAQRYGQNANNAAFGNQAQQQLYNQTLGNSQFGNQAQAQGFEQGLANANLGNAAQNQTFNQTLANAGFGNTAQQQQFQNANTTTGLNNDLGTQRFNNQITGNNQNINQLLALLGAGQVNSSPQFQSTPQTGIAGTDVSGNAWNAFNANQGQSNQMWNGLGALGGTAASLLPFLLSDKRAKTDIRDTGMRTPGGVPIKDWRYKGSPMMQRGYIAQDVVKSGQRDAVAKTPGGFLAVNYRKVA